ncbi:ABC transporter substrate-binding protein [Reinekea sp. G2M2-21]|uniref:substrate-binding periplasmic protein n=1 Tax=Reinekea sp. G2M2-21 TaxID=2788942 RepID=UPI001E648BE2|nr:transporter substrate-binding domain-containing protein [Reinekea sp. G2M2-21]
MIRIFRMLNLFFFISFFSSQLYADNFKMAVGLALPPYVIQNGNTGMEMEIVREALALKGHTVEPVYLPFARVPLSLKEKSVSLALTVNENSGLSDIFYSDSHITYQNVAITLAKNNLTINSSSDMKDMSILAFQDATKYLGSDYASMALKNPDYQEKSQQDAQILMLFSNRVDTVVMDINIFKYFRSLNEKVDTSLDVTIHKIFSPSLYKVGFLSETIRDEFNDALAQLKESGRYDEIISEYIQ